MLSLTSSDEEGAQSSHPLGLTTSEVPEELGNDTGFNESFEETKVVVERKRESADQVSFSLFLHFLHYYLSLFLHFLSQLFT